MEFMKSKLIVALILCLTVFSGAETEIVSREQTLHNDFVDGLLSRAEYLAYSLMGIRNSKELPQRYRALPQSPTRKGIGLMLEAYALVDKVFGTEKELLQSALIRPDDLPLSLISPSGFFKLHYTDIGYNAAADTFVAQAATAFDYCYDLLINQLHFDPPPQDDVDGPQYDVYIRALGNGAYGGNTLDGAAPTEKHPHGAVSFIEINNTYNTGFYTQGVDGMLVTTAHEFFHMVQFGYRAFTSSVFNSTWLYEGCAVWMEDYAFDEINDYLQYLPYYLFSLDKSFFYTDNLHEYGTCIFYKMLEQKYGAGIIRKIWEQFATKGVFEALDDALREQGSSFALELSDHAIWNYFTGSRAIPEEYYEEGDSYPEVTPGATDSLAATRTISGKANLLSAAYIKVELQDFGEMSIQPEMNAPSNWMYAVIHKAAGLPPATFISPAGSSVLLPDVTPASDVFVIPVNVHMPEKANSSLQEEYSFSLKLGEIGKVKAGIQSIAPNPYLPAVHTRGIRINVRLTEKTDKLGLYIATEQGRIIYSQTTTFQSSKKGDFSLYWDGRNSSEQLAAAGVYVVFIEAGQPIAPGKIALVR